VRTIEVTRSADTGLRFVANVPVDSHSAWSVRPVCRRQHCLRVVQEALIFQMGTILP